ncbi:MAG: hypothetical protein KJ968_00090 [Nanoarchaeota archaeon]|nr:hypothetical protein [Nanoarchaeota archaeon]
MRSNKKAGLQISINAIVILILAITVLGIGLAFIRGMFSQTIGQLGEVSKDIENDMINRIRDSDERLVLREENIEIKKSGEKTIYFGIRNEEEDEAFFYVEFRCDSKMDEDANLDDITFSVFKETKTLERDEIMVLPAIIKVSPKAVATTYMCSALINEGDYASKTFYITVTK